MSIRDFYGKSSFTNSSLIVRHKMSQRKLIPRVALFGISAGLPALRFTANYARRVACPSDQAVLPNAARLSLANVFEQLISALAHL